jgi:hypothetical protein
MVTQQTLHLPATIQTIPTTPTVQVTQHMEILITMRLRPSTEVLGVTTPPPVDHQTVNKEITKIMLWNPIILLQEVIIKEMVTRILRLEMALHIGNSIAVMVTINMLVMGMQISIIVEVEVVLMALQIMVKRVRVHITWGITPTIINREIMVIMEAGDKEICIMG